MDSSRLSNWNSHFKCRTITWKDGGELVTQGRDGLTKLFSCGVRTGHLVYSMQIKISLEGKFLPFTAHLGHIILLEPMAFNCLLRVHSLTDLYLPLYPSCYFSSASHAGLVIVLWSNVKTYYCPIITYLCYLRNCHQITFLTTTPPTTYYNSTLEI